MNGRPERILVIDDEECIRFTFECFLSDAGYEVATACTYEEGMAEIEQKEFDLIFSDLILGGKTGLDLLHEVRLRAMSCPVVLITGDPTEGISADALQKGAFDFIPKPVLQDKLLQVTREALSNNESGTEGTSL